MKKFILIIITGFIALNLSAQGISVKPLVNNPSCYGNHDGSIELFVDGGIAPYTFSWDNGLPASPTQAFLGAGSYQVTIADNANNRTTTTIEVINPSELILTTSIKDVTTHGGNNGEVKLEVSGGTPGYSFEWNNQSTDQNLWDIPVGNYSVVVTDASGCTATASVNIYQAVMLPSSNATSYSMQSTTSPIEVKSKKVTNNDNETASNVVVYPNPASNVVNVTGTANESEITLIDMNGQVVNQQRSTGSETQINVSAVANGNYVMLVRNGNESTSKIVSIAR